MTEQVGAAGAPGFLQSTGSSESTRGSGAGSAHPDACSSKDEDAPGADAAEGEERRTGGQHSGDAVCPSQGQRPGASPYSAPGTENGQHRESPGLNGWGEAGAAGDVHSDGEAT